MNEQNVVALSRIVQKQVISITKEVIAEEIFKL